jgi:hypothetical protein
MQQFFYGYLRGQTEHRTGPVVEIVEDRLKQVLIPVISRIEFDEEFYTKSYADVAEKLRAGELSSARDHYIRFGYFEDRLPRSIAVDENWYLKTYTDVAEAVANGVLLSGKQHFLTRGFKEGRLPSEGWTLLGTKLT